MSHRLCIIGAGYVGLPLAVAYSSKYETILYTHSSEHVQELKKGVDRTENFSSKELLACDLMITSDIEDIGLATVYIVTVPTPVDQKMRPDLSHIESATRTVGSVLKKGDIVVYESTVFIGCTEELCVPILQEYSGLVCNEDFFCGYSPERINPTDKEHTIRSVVKIVAGSTPETTEILAAMYGSIVDAGIYKAASIKVAEASKLLENVQRDVNIALMNELSSLYKTLGIMTADVIEAASTKWNFNPYHPGLVGGHCIGVDPYYLIYNAHNKEMKLPIIEQARRSNNLVAQSIVDEIEALMLERSVRVEGSHALILGLSFKQNCSDIRNSQSAIIYNRLKSKGADIDVVDPFVRAKDAEKAYSISVLMKPPKDKRYDIIIVAVAHEVFKELDWEHLKKPSSVLFDVKDIVPKRQRDLWL